MSRVEFRLRMPSRGSWNGEWSGAGRNYVIVRSLSQQAIAKLLDGQPTRSWFHSWSDGWCAEVAARVMKPGERATKSDGFAGYNWMVTNILAHGSTDKIGEALG